MEEKRKHRIFPVILAAAAACLILFFVFSTGSGGSGDSQAEAMKQAVMRCCVQCYAIEGVYPPSIEYLRENYGLSINTDDYYVVYDVFASNVPPEVRIVSKNAA